MASTYSWQCLDCKTCCVCSDPGGEEEMVFCDRCDRGYHTFCVDMRGIPEGGLIRVCVHLYVHVHVLHHLLLHVLTIEIELPCSSGGDALYLV